MSYNLRGRPATAAIDPVGRERLSHSTTWISHCANKPLLAIVESLIDTEAIGFFTGCVGFKKPVPFLCYLFRLLQLVPDVDLVRYMVEQDVHKYLRVAAMIFLRLVGDEKLVVFIKETCIDDYRKIRCINEEGSYVILHVDEIVDELCVAKGSFLGLPLPTLFGKAKE